jgi:hypothetical protein
VGGGRHNLVQADFGTIAGGGPSDTSDSTATRNVVYDDYGTIGGGGDNQAGSSGNNTSNAPYATVGGGFNNAATEDYATVSGGENNTASGEHATVPGGDSNTASGDYSFAAGHNANADDHGSFVWADSTGTERTSPGSDTFSVVALKGFYFGDDDPIIPSGRYIHTSTGAYLSTAGEWKNNSDRATKTNIIPVDGRVVLEQVSQLPLSTWQYRTEDASVRHMGPMAQDFYAAFGLGGDHTSIGTIDADGVSLAAIQGLHSLNQEQASRIADLEAENASLQTQVDDLEARLSALEAALSTSGEG